MDTDEAPKFFQSVFLLRVLKYCQGIHWLVPVNSQELLFLGALKGV